MNLNNAILKTLAYSDIFEHPLTVDELHRFLVVSACKQEVISCLQDMDHIRQQDGYYFLSGREEIAAIRKYRESVSQRAYQRAQRYGRMLAKLPFVRMVALTGSLAMRNCDQTGDYDYMLVTSSGRVWTARIFALILNKFANLFGETLCPNLIVSERKLEWKEHNLYAAREIVQMDLIHGVDVFIELRVVNKWVEEFLPNWNNDQITKSNEDQPMFQKIVELFLDGKMGDKFEAWEMDRKIRKFSKQTGFGVETQFDTEICQGNFGHHGVWAMQRYQQRLEKLNLVK